jgi:hypothetical protein
MPEYYERYTGCYVHYHEHRHEYKSYVFGH